MTGWELQTQEGESPSGNRGDRQAATPPPCQSQQEVRLGQKDNFQNLLHAWRASQAAVIFVLQKKQSQGS